ncbi:MAG: hypothetical protein IV100_24940 [Myxococcales bacterium]|nr:hypothetical protein [Myxococcales bacterium]
MPSALVKFVAVFALLLSTAVSAKGPKLFAPGNTYVYQVDDSYLFIVTLTAHSAKGYEFKWLMTNDIGKQGRVVVPKAAKDAAKKLFNYFGSGESKLTDETSVFVSTAVWKDLKAKKAVTLGLGKEDATFIDADDGGFMPVPVDSRYGDIGSVPVIVVADKAKGYSMTLLDNVDFPLIVKMDIGFKVRLLAVL